ncbi:MAG TPA: hypothetical protein PLO78_00770 [Candidatus Omnitrophota bacterium]|nr:hypothetical protein [Candidatus Omnitrophota bacterium]
MKRSRLQVISSLLFFYFFFSGFSLSSSKNEGRSYPLPGNFEDIWNATIATLEAEKIPLAKVDKANGYIQSATFPLYKKEYKNWAKAPTFSSAGFCAIEVGVVEKDPSMTVLGLKAYFKRKVGYHLTGFGKRDSSRGVFEGRLAHRIHKRLVESKFPKMKSIILGCDLHFDDATLHYVIVGADEHQLAYEQGLRNGDVLLKIDDETITPGNLFNHFINIEAESLKKVTIFRDKQEIELPVSVFYLNPDAPHFGFYVERNSRTKKFTISRVQTGGPAEKEGLLPGDALLKQNNILLDNWKNYYRVILMQKGNEPQTFLIERRGTLIEKKIMPVSEATKEVL